MNRSALLTFGGSILALALGAVAATCLYYPRATPESGYVAEASVVADAVTAAPGRPVHPSLVEALREDTGANRWLRLLAASEEATVHDLPGLIRAAGRDMIAVRMLGARWAELDPGHMFRSLYADYLVPEDAPGTLPGRSALTEALFERWTATDARAAVKALTDVPNFARRDSLRMTVINHLMKGDVEQGLLAMNEWNVRNYLPDLKKVNAWAEQDPRHAAEVAVRLGGTLAGREVLKLIGKAWAQRAPEEGLRFAASLPAQTRASFAGELIGHWAQRDLAGAVQFAESEKDLAFRNALSGGLVSSWGKSDPAAALAWSNEHLRGSARSDAIGALIKAAAEEDIAGAAELVAGMDAGPVQVRACASIFDTWFKKGKDQRDAAFEWLSGITNPEVHHAAFEGLQWNWMWEDPAGAKDFISGPYGGLAPERMVAEVAQSQAAKNPEAALEWAESLGKARAKHAKSAILERWISLRPEGAATYVRKLPSGAEREQAIGLVSRNLLWKSPKQAAEWCHSLPADDQKLARQAFDGAGLSPEKRQELEKALSR